MSRRMVQRLKLASAALGFGVAFGPLTCVRQMDEAVVPGLASVGTMGVVAQFAQSSAGPNWAAEPIEQRQTGD